MRQPIVRPNPGRSELGNALAACRGAFISIGLMSGMSNILMLTGAIFMLEVYDRVLPSRSVPTLVGLVILAAGLYMALGLLDCRRTWSFWPALWRKISVALPIRWIPAR